MHYCCNIVTAEKGIGSAVLIRAVEPIDAEEHMHTLRQRSGYELSNGPGKLCQALGIDVKLNGHDLTQVPLKLIVQPSIDSNLITISKRIGISQAKETLWRFFSTDNPYVSH